MKRAHARGAPDRAAPVPRAAGAQWVGVPPAPDRGALLWHPALLAALLAVAVYLPSLHYGFVWDDHRLIEVNPQLRSLGGLVHLMTSDFWITTGRDASGFWRPLINLSYGLDGRLSHWSPWLFRVMNVLAHAAVSALVALLALEGGAPRAAALVAALWFAAMPAHVESVAWIAGRTDVYCAVFMLLALLLDRRARRAGRGWCGAGALVALGLALLSKELAAPFVVLVALAEWLESRERGWDARSSLRWLGPYVALTAIYLVAHGLLVKTPPPPSYLDPVIQQRGRWGVWLMFPGYVAFLWPWFPHSPAATLALPAAPWTPGVIAAAASQLCFLALLAWLAQRRARAALPLTLFWLGLLPSTVVLITQAYLLYSERFLYLPSAGLAWGVALGLGALARWRVLRVAGLALVALLALASARQTLRTLPAWASDAELFHSMTERDPRNFRGRVEWARVLVVAGREREAEQQLAIAEQLDPRRPEVPSVRALIHYRHGEWALVLAESERAVTLDSMLVEPRLSRATALLRMGRRSEAGAALRALIAELGEDPAVQSLWGQYLVMTGHPDRALPFLVSSARWQTDDADLEFALGAAEARLGRVMPARAAFTRAVEIDSTFYDGWLKLAVACHLVGDRVARDRALARAAELPNAADGRAAQLRARLNVSGSPP